MIHGIYDSNYIISKFYIYIDVYNMIYIYIYMSYSRMDGPCSHASQAPMLVAFQPVVRSGERSWIAWCGWTMSGP